MPVMLPHLVQTPSPNASGRTGSRTRLIVVHDTEGTYAGAVAWFAMAGSRVSAHLVMREDGGEVTQMVPLCDKAWHACAYNSISIGIEGAGVAERGFPDAWWNAMATIVAWLLRRYGLPCRWAQGGVGEGVCSHHDLGPAGGGHNDPCAIGSAEWTRFLCLVEATYQDLGGAPLPEWALHGLPAPSTISPPPSGAVDATSHGGRSGAEADDTRLSTGGARYPLGSLADVQQRLNFVGASPSLLVDGCCGPATVAATENFQRKLGLSPDGIVGAATWSALERATT